MRSGDLEYSARVPNKLQHVGVDATLAELSEHPRARPETLLPGAAELARSPPRNSPDKDSRQHPREHRPVGVPSFADLPDIGQARGADIATPWPACRQQASASTPLSPRNNTLSLCTQKASRPTRQMRLATTGAQNNRQHRSTMLLIAKSPRSNTSSQSCTTSLWGHFDSRTQQRLDSRMLGRKIERGQTMLKECPELVGALVGLKLSCLTLCSRVQQSMTGSTLACNKKERRPARSPKRANKCLRLLGEWP